MVLAQTTDLERVIQARDFVALHEMLKHWSPGTAASLIEPLPVEQQVVAFRLLPRDLAAEVFEYISLEAQQQLVKAMATEEVAKMLNDMAPDDRTALLDELPASVTQQLLNLLSPHERSIAVSLLGYPEGSVGRIMTPDYVRVRPDWTIEHALDHIRRYGQDSETLSIVYVISDDGHLIGEVPIRKILLSSLPGHLADLVHERVVALKATDPQEAAVRLFQTEGRAALPVTDSQGVLIGIVTLDDALNLAESQNTRTLQRFGGVEALDEPYLQTPILSMIRRRAGWLVILFLGEMLTATAMGFFERQIERAVVLASGLALGVILGAIGFSRIAVWSAFSNLYGPHWPLVALTVGLALVGIVLWGTLAGSMLPMVLRRLGFDPATSSAPFVATLVDVTGLVIYFSVAILVLRGTLL